MRRKLFKFSSLSVVTWRRIHHKSITFVRKSLHLSLTLPIKLTCAPLLSSHHHFRRFRPASTFTTNHFIPSRMRKQQRQTSAPPSSYGTLMGESLLHADNDADGTASNKPIINNGYQNNNNGPSSSTPQYFEQPPRGKFEYTQPLNNHPIPVQHYLWFMDLWVELIFTR